MSSLRMGISMLSFNARCIGAAVLGLALLALAAPASAAYHTYQGQIQLLPIADRGCASTAPEGTYSIMIYGRDDGPMRIEGYIVSDKLVHARILGNNINQLAILFPGDTEPKHSMRLRAAGVGQFVGDLQVQTLIGVAALCAPVNAQIRFALINGQSGAEFQQAAGMFQNDTRAVQAFAQGGKGQIKEALPAFNAAFAAAKTSYGPSHPQLAIYLWLQGMLHQYEGTYADALPAFRDAAVICDKFWNAQSACSGIMLVNLSYAQLRVGNTAEAEATARRALAICDKFFGQGAPVSGTALNTLGAAELQSGRYGEAETTFLKALKANAASGNTFTTGITLVDLGLLYRFMGQYQKAEKVIRKALELSEKTSGPENAITIMDNVVLAQVIRAEGRPAEAEPVARQALATARHALGPERQDNPALLVALMALAESLREQGKFSEAEPLYREALANAVKYTGPNSIDVGTVETLYAQLLRVTGREFDAHKLLLHAYRVFAGTGNRMVAWRVPKELMLVFGSGKISNPTVAIFYGKEAVNDLQTMRGNLSNSGNEAQASFVSATEVSSVYRTLADLLVSQGRLSEAQEVLAMLKEQELYDFTDHKTNTAENATQAEKPATVATLNSSEKQLAAITSKEVNTGQEYALLAAKYAKQHSLNAADQARFDTLTKQLDVAQKTFDTQAETIASAAKDPEMHKRLLHEIDDNSRAFHGTLKSLGHNAVVLQYYIMDDNVKILLTTPDIALAREATIKRADLNAQILSFRKTLSNPYQDPTPQAQALYKVLIAPVEADLQQAGAKTLMLSLDDTLRYVPFAALYDGKNYLVEHYSVAMLTDAVRDKIAAAPAANWTVWGLGVTKGGEGYDELPNVGVELNDIAGQKGILTGQVMLDKSFTESALRAGIAQAYPIIHIASHFQFTPGSMDDSFLLLGDGSHMTLAEFRTKLNLNGVEMLTLSACQTGVGDDNSSRHGVEVEGLGAIAQQSGAKAVLATLWPVADGSTALLMSTLYKEHKVDHLDKADSLRQAQLTLLNGSATVDPNAKSVRGLSRVAVAQGPATFKQDPGKPFAHPFYWAPFILMGNWL
jgi:CHAT domain-containing protein/Flp pilus assembly protein TadD